MAKKVLIAVMAVFLLFGAFVASRPSEFRYERSGLIDAPAAKIFPYLNDFHRGQQWSPFDKPENTMKRVYSGPAAGLGSVMEFEGDSNTGSGRLEIVREVPLSQVDVRLQMTSPMKADNSIHYLLKPEGSATRFTWIMEGDSGFLGKLVGIFIDCEKMMAGKFEEGISKLKSVAEAAP